MLGIKIKIKSAGCPFCNEMIKVENIKEHKIKCLPNIIRRNSVKS